MLELVNICKKFNAGSVDEMTLFDNFNLQVETGEFIAIVGSNGSGKTSMLNLICGSMQPDSGEVRIGGHNIVNEKEFMRYNRIGRVYQNTSLGTCPHMTMLENMALADNKGKKYNLTRGVNKKRIDFYKEQLSAVGLGLEDKLDVKMGALSGGQRQVVALIMATMCPLDFLILDEHTAALDPRTADIVMHLTDTMVREKNLTAMMVTHNLRYAVDYGSRMLMLDKGKVVLDRAGEDKKVTTVDDVLEIFNKISIECGN